VHPLSARGQGPGRSRPSQQCRWDAALREPAAGRAEACPPAPRTAWMARRATGWGD